MLSPPDPRLTVSSSVTLPPSAAAAVNPAMMATWVPPTAAVNLSGDKDNDHRPWGQLWLREHANKCSDSHTSLDAQNLGSSKLMQEAMETTKPMSSSE